MAMGLPSRDGAESNRIVSEKAAAATAGIVAESPYRQTDAECLFGGGAVAAALKPMPRTVKANARRLRKRRWSQFS
jgi:hypothetical protein